MKDILFYSQINNSCILRHVTNRKCFASSMLHCSGHQLKCCIESTGQQDLQGIRSGFPGAKRYFGTWYFSKNAGMVYQSYLSTSIITLIMTIFWKALCKNSRKNPVWCCATRNFFTKNYKFVVSNIFLNY